MKKIIALLGLIMIMAFSFSKVYAEQPDRHIAVFNVQPEMNSENDENNIKTNLRFEKGVNEISTDIQAKTVRVVYDANKIDVPRLIEAFANIGFKATEVEPK